MLNTKKQIAEGLTLQATDEGIWLHFETTDGRKVGLNLINYSGKLGSETIQRWAREYYSTEVTKNR